MKILTCKRINRKTFINIKNISAIISICSCIGVQSQNNTPTWTGSGSIGIGTVTPQQPLHVVGKTRFDVNTTGAGGGRFFHTRPALTNYENFISFGTNGTSTYDWVIGTATSSSDFMIGGWSASNAFKILAANGNVGIGMGSLIPPSDAKLQVGGNVLFSHMVTGITSAPFIKYNNAMSTAALPDYTWYQDDNSGIFHPASDVIGFSVSGAEKMRIHSNGFVGIGTNNPTGLLEIKDNTGKSFVFYGNGWGDVQSTTSFRPHFATGTDFTIFEGNVGSGTQRMAIKNSGEVTINNLAGNGFRYVLVDGNGKLSEGTAPIVNTIDWALGGNNTSTSAQYIGTINGADFNINTTNSTRVTVKADGKVGIGNTTPNAKLQIDVPTNNTNALQINSNNFSLFDYNSNGGLVIGRNYAPTAPIWAKAPGLVVTPSFDVNGNAIATRVGIGTEEPTANLEIASPINTPATAVLGSKSNDKSAIYWAGNWGTGGYGFGLDDRGTDHNIGGIFTGVTTRERIMSFYKGTYGPQVWIGDKKGAGNHADATLSVDGKGLFRSLYVNTSTAVWADYVFENDYKLVELSEVEAYYKKHKHLPNVPSAKDMEENGDNIVETDATLLRKIEELTIYLVQLEKEVKYLKKQINNTK